MLNPNPWTEEEVILLTRVVSKWNEDPVTASNQPKFATERDIYRQLLIKYLRVILKNESIDYLSSRYFDSEESFTDSELALIQLISSKVEGHYS